MLDEALESLSSESKDGHISDLAARCRALEAEGGFEIDGVAKLGGDGDVDVDGRGGVLHKVGSTEEQEEVEKDV